MELPDEITFSRKDCEEWNDQPFQAMTDEQWQACWRSMVEHFDDWIIRNLHYKENDK